MTTIQKLKESNINLAAVGLLQRDDDAAYFCTPQGAQMIGWAGVDGIHYCCIEGLGDTVFAVSPMGGPTYVHPIARNTEQLMRLLLACGDMAAIEQAHRWNKQQFYAFLRESVPTSEQKAVLEQIGEALCVSPMDEPYEYIRSLQSEFDYSRIRLSKEYYDLTGDDNAPPEEAQWKVTYEGSLWGAKGRAGTEIPIQKCFEWGGKSWFIPAIYSCEKGLVVDFCMKAAPEEIKAYIEKYDLLNEEAHSYSDKEMHRIQREHPLNVDFCVRALLNGKPLTSDHGSGAVWIPPSCLGEGAGCEPEAQRVLEHYGLDLSWGWMVRRHSFAWAQAKKPVIKSLALTLKRDPVEILGSTFASPSVGDRLSFVHPVSGASHTLTVNSYEQERLDRQNMRGVEMELPEYFHSMSYTLSPELPDRSFMLKDCAESDQPHFRPTASAAEPGCSDATIGIIGGADGPTAIVLSVPTAPKLHTACSSLHFEPVEKVEWQMVFKEKPVEDITVEVLL